MRNSEPAAARADIEAKLAECPHAAGSGQKPCLPFAHVFAIDADQRAPALAHDANKNEADGLIDRADLACPLIDGGGDDRVALG